MLPFFPYLYGLLLFVQWTSSNISFVQFMVIQMSAKIVANCLFALVETIITKPLVITFSKFHLLIAFISLLVMFFYHMTRLGVNYFVKVINYIQLHWKLFN